MISFLLNGVPARTSADPDKPLLWVLRDEAQLTGTKFGCGLGQCGACNVLVDGEPVRSCVTGVGSVHERSVTTIEGLSDQSAVLQAWKECAVPQCGYCQSGQLIAAAALLERHPNPDQRLVDEVMRHQLCRCGTYPRIRKAISRAAEIMGQAVRDSEQ